MKITIVGSGNVGTALGQGLSRAGHDITFGVRNPESPKSIKAISMIPNATIQTIKDGCKNAEVIIITTPPEVVLELIPDLGDLKGKTMIDATNSIRSKPEPFPTAYHALKALTKSQNIAKCFNTTGFENMANPIYNEKGIDMFVAGDNEEAKKIAQQLAVEIGFENCYNFGGDDKVELLEKFALSWINLAIMQGHGRNLAVKLLSR
jgi:predicted dinucleotide-binding enzyme